MSETAYTEWCGDRVVVMPVQWARYRDIDLIKPINESDSPCLAEVREVLKRHNRLDRFGVALLHSHFEPSDDEVMLETGNEEMRTLTLRPVSESSVGSNDVPTIIALQDGDSISTMAWCRRYCQRDFIFGHYKSHDRAR